jgi:hypothetical protein
MCIMRAMEGSLPLTSSDRRAAVWLSASVRAVSAAAWKIGGALLRRSRDRQRGDRAQGLQVGPARPDLRRAEVVPLLRPPQGLDLDESRVQHAFRLRSIRCVASNVGRRAGRGQDQRVGHVGALDPQALHGREQVSHDLRQRDHPVCLLPALERLCGRDRAGADQDDHQQAGDGLQAKADGAELLLHRPSNPPRRVPENYRENVIFGLTTLDSADHGVVFT